MIFRSGVIIDLHLVAIAQQFRFVSVLLKEIFGDRQSCGTGTLCYVPELSVLAASRSSKAFSCLFVDHAVPDTRTISVLFMLKPSRFSRRNNDCIVFAIVAEGAPYDFRAIEIFESYPTCQCFQWIIDVPFGAHTNGFVALARQFYIAFTNTSLVWWLTKCSVAEVSMLATCLRLRGSYHEDAHISRRGLSTIHFLFRKS